jgi:hypothetical protein
MLPSLSRYVPIAQLAVGCAASGAAARHAKRQNGTILITPPTMNCITHIIQIATDAILDWPIKRGRHPFG